MSKQDYYDLLGAAKGASDDEIKKSYRKMAMKYHPDRNQGDESAEAKFKEISEAYEVLKDEQKRAAYDRYGHAAFDGSGGGMGGGAAGAGFGGFSDIFSDLFGEMGGGAGGGRRQQAARGADLRYNMAISLEDAFNGLKETINFKTSVACDACDCTGSADQAHPATCNTCGGMGKVRAQQGFFTIERTCHTCNGSGQMIKKPCRSCNGQGRARKDRTLSVNIPAGVDEGTRMRLNSEGEVGVRGARAGDLYIFISLIPHKFFQREGNDIYCEVPIKMTSLALGTSIEVPTIDGSKAKVTIPAGTQSDQQFRLRGKGMKDLDRGTRGDMYIQVQVEIPVNLNKKQKELLQSFDDTIDSKGSQPKSDSFFNKVKEFWGDL